MVALNVIEVILLMYILYYVVQIRSENNKKRKPVTKKPLVLKELTGRYKHRKTPSGNEVLVEYKKNKESIAEYRKATAEDRLLLVQAGLLKE